jgi:glycosyltransferase involved in cell wall biosynthesis
MSVIAVIPAYNEGRRVADVIKQVLSHVSRAVVVDDGSSDDTAEQAARAGATVIHHIENCGAGAATMTGVEYTRKLHPDAIVTLDADGQHNPEDIPYLLKALKEQNVDLVFANRFGQRNRIPLIRRLANAMGNIITLCATGKWMADSQCGFKVFGPKVIEQLDLRMNGFEYCTEIVRETAKRRWRSTQVPTKVLYSEYTLAKGQSFANGMKTAMKILLRSFLR